MKVKVYYSASKTIDISDEYATLATERAFCESGENSFKDFLNYMDHADEMVKKVREAMDAGVYSVSQVWAEEKDGADKLMWDHDRAPGVDNGDCWDDD